MRLIFLPFACLLIAGFTHAQTNTNLGTNSGNGGRDNTSIGYQAGNVVTGNMNSFLGSLAGKVNTSGASNSFFGYAAGYLNTSGSNNSFFGRASGFNNTTGIGNTFFWPLCRTKDNHR
jgi:hypothetical protein